MKNILVLVSGSGTNLQKIIDKINEGYINGKIIGLISSSKKAFSINRAIDNNIPYNIISKAQFKDYSEYQNAVDKKIREYAPDLIVLAGYLSILSKEITREYEYKIINIHPSLIPSFCGMGYYGIKVHQSVIDFGAKISGATVHFVNENADEGKIIFQKAVDVLEDDTAESLQLRIMEKCEWVLLPKAVKLFCEDKIKIVNNKVKIESEIYD